MSALPTTSGGRSIARWIRGLNIQGRVIYALMLRTALGHHGHKNLGFFWIVGEPLFLMAGIMVLWSFANITHGSGVEVIPFALTGYAFITLWRHLAGQAVHLLRHNQNLRYHTHIKTLDIFFAKGLLETLSLFTAFTISYIPLYLLGYCPLISDPLNLIAGFALTGWFSLGVAMIVSSLSEMNSVVKNVMGAVMYITLPVTGAFTMQEWLPQGVRSILSWSPLVNCIEMIRSGLFGPDVPTHYDLFFTVTSCFVVWIAGLQLSRYAELCVEE